MVPGQTYRAVLVMGPGRVDGDRVQGLETLPRTHWSGERLA